MRHRASNRNRLLVVLSVLLVGFVVVTAIATAVARSTDRRIFRALMLSIVWRFTAYKGNR